MTDTMQELRQELHEKARLHVALARMDGRIIDKKLMRFNDIVDAAIQYGRMSSPFCAHIARGALLSETIDQCVVGADFYRGTPFDPKEYAWTEAGR